MRAKTAGVPARIPGGRLLRAGAALSALYFAHVFFPTGTRTLFRAFAPLAIVWSVSASAALPPIPSASRKGRLAQIMKNALPALLSCAAIVLCAEKFVFKA